MPITRRYGQQIIPQLAQAAGEAQGELRGMEMDQRLVQQAFNRSLQAEELRLQNQLQQAKLDQKRRAQQRRGSGTMPNRARTIYPNRTAAAGESPLQQQVRKAAAQFQRRQEDQERAFTEASPYDPSGREPYAELQGPDQTFRAEGDEIVTSRGDEVVDRAPSPAAPRRSRRSQSKMAAIRSVAADDILQPRQLEAAQQMSADDDIDLQEFRQWLSQSIRVAETQRERAAEEGRAAGGLAAMADPSQRWQAQYYSTEKRAQATAEEAEQLRQFADPPRPDMTEDEFRQWLNENVTDDDQSNVPFYLGSEGQHRETIIDERLQAFRQFQNKAQDAAELETQRKRLLGQTDGGGGTQLPQGDGASPNAQQARQFLQAANGDKEKARQLAREHGFKF